jgi:hypothetical protein
MDSVKNNISVLMYRRHKLLNQIQHVNFDAITWKIPVLISDIFANLFKYFQCGALKRDVAACSKLQNL